MKPTINKNSVIDNPIVVDICVSEYDNFGGIETFTGVVKDNYGDIASYLNGKLHRDNGPAVTYADGSKEYWFHGKLHRKDGPAIEYANGDKKWYLNGKLHRKDGPAVEWANGYKEWWFNGKNHGSYDDFTNSYWIIYLLDNDIVVDDVIME